MIDQVFKLAAAAAAAAAAWYADKYVKEKTGKHIHEHAVDFVKNLWTRLKNWAAQYLADHERIRKVYLSAISIAAAAKRAKNDGLKFGKIKIFGQQLDTKRPQILREEEIDLSQIDEVMEQAKREPILAMRH